MKAKTPPTSPKRNVQEKKSEELETFFSESSDLVRPQRGGSIGRTALVAALVGTLFGAAAAAALVALAFSQPQAAAWSWLGISFPERQTEVVVRESNAQETVTNLVSVVGPSVVALSTQSGNILARDSLGSGIALSSDGLVLSLTDVLAPATHAVLADGTVAASEGDAAEDAASPYAVRKIAASGMSVAAFVRPETLTLGEPLIVLSRTAGGDLAYRAVALSELAALPRSDGAEFFLSTESYARRYVLDSALPASYRGAPVFTLSGEAVGLVSDPEAGAVLPISSVQPALSRLLEKGTFSRSRLGVRYWDIASMPGIAAELVGEQRTGALLAGDEERGIVAVAAGSPAEAAELAAGDIITAVNGEMLLAPEALTDAIQRADIGETLTLTVVRKGAAEEIEATIGSAR